jgi:hypothetical protein
MISFTITPMTSTARLESEPMSPFKQGSYGKVEFIEFSGENRPPTPRKRGFLARFSGKPEPVTPLVTWDEIAEAVISGTLDGQQLANFSNGYSAGSSEGLASVVVSIVSKYRDARKAKQRALRQDLRDEEALVLSDFFEIIPKPLAARMLLATANPNVARNLAISVSDVVDTQQCAIETVSLLPKNVRIDLFGEMAKLDKDRAYALFRLFVSNWSTRLSDFCGQRAIEASLSQELCDNKIAEVSDDFCHGGTIAVLVRPPEEVKSQN